ncbi:9388_t:CDS:2 [Acaulospora colombiana]|uniref:9388_t:CDS:1 n=1 Tax=Acaulospora colombiana TaxID=27376 RepID=A0ACA9KKY9_9GLOM|nr:9388_t:CDS:2 [Acaulospora colombiana]
MTENEVTNSSTAGAVIEPEKVPKEGEPTTEPPTSKNTEDAPIEEIEEGTLEKYSQGLHIFHNSRYFAFGTGESKVPQENLRQYYKKFRKTIKISGSIGATPEGKETPAEDKATTSAAVTEENAEVIQAKHDEPNSLLHLLSTNIAHATQTGKGLLFYYKSKEHMKEPLGIINLKFVEDVKESNGAHEFKIITKYREYSLVADSETTRKRWITTILARTQQSKEFPLPETEEYKNTYNQVYQDRFLKDSGVTSDSENYTSGEDTEIKNRRKTTFNFFSKKPEKTDKTDKTETTTTTEVTETVEGSSSAAVKKETTAVATTPSTTVAETVAVEKTEETAETNVEKTEKTETSPVTPQKSYLFRFWGRKDDAHGETKVVETAEQTEITSEAVVEEGAKTTEVGSNARKPVGLIRKITKVFRKESSGDSTREVKEVKVEEEAAEEVVVETAEKVEKVEKVEEVVAGSSTEENKEETSEVKKEEISEVKKEEETKEEKKEEKKEKASLFKRLSKHTHPSQQEEVKPNTQPTTDNAITSAAEATDEESENVVLKKMTNPPRKHGCLNKSGYRLMKSSYEQRYFVFTQEGSLNYYKGKKDDSEPKKIEINHDVKITKIGELGFQIETKPKNFKLYAQNTKERDEWIDELEEYKKSLPVTNPEDQSSSSKAQDDAEKGAETEEKPEEKVDDKTEITEVQKVEETIVESKTEVETVKTTEVVTEVKIEEKAEEKTEKVVEEILEKVEEEAKGGESEKIEEEAVVETSTTTEEKNN